MAILAAEDVGLADPAALGVVMAAAAAFDYVGLPEGQFHLSQACLYLATAPKSNSAMGDFDALETVRRERIGEVPDPLKDGNRDAELGHGSGYLYPHAYRDHWVAQQYLPDHLKGQAFYEPGDQGAEVGLRDSLMRRREAQWAAMEEGSSADGWSVTSPGLLQPLSRAGSRDGTLRRASESGGEILRQARDDLFRFTGLNRSHQALVLGSPKGFLGWEALRRCVEGGVTLRCEPEEAEALQAWSEKLEAFSSPEWRLSSLLKFPENLQTHPWHGDWVLGFELPDLCANPEWIRAISQGLPKNPAWGLAFSLPQIGWAEVLGMGFDMEIRNQLEKSESQWALNCPRRHRLWESALESAGFQLSTWENSYMDSRHWSPSQAQALAASATADVNSLIFALIQSLPEPSQKKTLNQALVSTLSGVGVPLRKTYRFIKANGLP
jgi:hypothetical protein